MGVTYVNTMPVDACCMLSHRVTINDVVLVGNVKTGRSGA